MGYQQIAPKEESKGKQVAMMFSDMVNCHDRDSLNDMLEIFKREHRTLQEEEIMALFTVLKVFSQVGTDIRNQYSVNLAKKVMEFVENEIGEVNNKF